MEGQKFIARMNFEAHKHHKQNIREQIKPELIQKLQISENPSMNYMNAYKNVYKQELQKTLQQYKGKKIKDQCLSQQQKHAYISGLQGKNSSSMMGNSQQMPFKDYSNYSKTNSSSHYLANMFQKNINGRRFIDYDQERKNKFQTYIKNNYDGGQSFFKVQDDYQQKKQNQAANYYQILKEQLMIKQHMKINQKERILMQNMAVQDLRKKQDELDRQKYLQNQQNRGILKENINQQVIQQRLRKQRRSKQFQYNSVGLHNPILNPIEYHIDNPYILKKIQDQEKQQQNYK